MTQHVKRQSPQAQAITLLDAVARSEGLKVGKQTTTQLVLTRIRELTQLNPILMHGKRVEAMFAFVAAALGKCSAIREEDVGAVFAAEDVQPPDYRVVLLDGAELLIEVKNCHEATKPLRLKTDYVKRLANYGKLFDRPVKLAIYWSRWNAWSLVPLEILKLSSAKASIRFPDAMMANEMATLGDHMIGTTPPLTLRLYSDPSESRKAARNQRHIRFRIRGVEVFCGGQRVEDKREQSIALHFMMFGRWAPRQKLEIQKNELVWLEWILEPEQPPADQEQPEQEFRIVGDASSMISRHFDFSTVSLSGEIERLQPLADPSKFGIDIPYDYKGKDVRLWRFVLQPPQRQE